MANYALSVFGALPVSGADVDLVVNVFWPICVSKTEAVVKLRGRIDLRRR